MRIPVLMTCTIVLVLSLSTTGSPAQPQQPLNVQLTTKAWDQFNRGAYEEAVKAADLVLDEFEAQARREQKTLQASKTPLPAIGKPSSEQEKKTIMERGVLNDAATALYIKGRASENLKKMDQAKSTYRLCQEYTYARTWDQQGWFWPPAQTCADRLAKLK